MRKELNQKEVNLVAVGIGVFLPAQMMNQQCAQSFIAAHRRRLQKLAKLMHLNPRVHVGQQLPGLFDRFLRRRIHTSFQIAVRWQINHELASQRGI
jgi:hypothetical protein